MSETSEVDMERLREVVEKLAAEHVRHVEAGYNPEGNAIFGWDDVMVILNAARALLRRGESRPATEKEIVDAYFGPEREPPSFSAQNDAYEQGWRDAEAHHAIGTAPDAREGEPRPACELCGEPMPPGEEMFTVHGYSGPCPMPPERTPTPANAPDAAREGISEAVELRKLLWLRHGCPSAALYGDDGEMQCSACFIDFKRWTPEQIEERWLSESERKFREALLAARPAPQAKGSEP